MMGCGTSSSMGSRWSKSFATKLKFRMTVGHV
jgi:hypothetical protein